jgi:Tfp pilus assembly protein PilV
VGRLRSENGLGLVELLIGITVLTVGLLALVAAFSSAIFAVSRSSNTTTASSLADSQVEMYRMLTYDWIGLNVSASVDSTYTGATACKTGTYTCGNTTPDVASACTSPNGAVYQAFPNACAPTRTVTGADGHSYRIDTYIRTVAANTAQTPYTRQYKYVTVIVRDGTKLTQLAREEEAFDCATGSGPNTSCP